MGVWGGGTEKDGEGWMRREAVSHAQRLARGVGEVVTWIP